MKWCACVGLCRVSFSIESNRAVTEGRRGEERRGEERGSLVNLLLLLLLQSIRQSEHCAIWTNSVVKTDTYGNTNSIHMHARMHTSIELQVHAHTEGASVYEVEHRKEEGHES